MAASGEGNVISSVSLLVTDASIIVRLMKHVALGLGCDRGCDIGVVRGAALEALAKIGLSERDVVVIASIDLKADEPALTALAAGWSVELRFFSAACLEKETPRLAHPSDLVFAHMGCHGVAEAAALAAVGQEGALLVPKFKGSGVTVAVAGWL